MLLLGGKYFWLNILVITLTIIIIIIDNASSSHHSRAEEQLTQSKANVVKRIYELLGKLEMNENELNSSTKFAALLGEYLIKQKVRFFQPTRYEEQIYYHMLHKLDAIIRKPDNVCDNDLQKEILDNIFQRQVLLMPPILKYGLIDANLEYESLANDYEQLVGTGFPNSTTSDLCLAALATLNGCKLSADCLHIIVTDEPTYGYQRMHQILLLYVLMHHQKCIRSHDLTLTYEILAHEHCTQAYREQNVIRSWGTPAKYHDLYLEQTVICGLFGYNEFMNWRNVMELQSWPNENGCFCLEQKEQKQQQQEQEQNYEKEQELERKPDCNCLNHLNNLALVFYINAFLLLN